MGEKVMKKEEMSFGRNDRLGMLWYGLGFCVFWVEWNQESWMNVGESWKTRCDDFEKHEIALPLILAAIQFWNDLWHCVIVWKCW